MKLSALSVCCLCLLGGCSGGGGEEPAPEQVPSTAPASTSMKKMTGAVQLTAMVDQRVEVGCGMCVYHMDGVNSCQTAAMVNGKPILIEGEWADAHSLGLCGGAKQALVSAQMQDGQLTASKVELR